LILNHCPDIQIHLEQAQTETQQTGVIEWNLIW
jgi:hypothetical protein